MGRIKTLEIGHDLTDLGAGHGRQARNQRAMRRSSCRRQSVDLSASLGKPQLSRRNDPEDPEPQHFERWVRAQGTSLVLIDSLILVQSPGLATSKS